MKIQCLIFDLDGTLTLSQQFHYQAFSRVFAEHGITYTEHDDLYRYAGMGSSLIFPTVFADHGITLTKDQIREYTAEKRALYDRIIHENEILPVAGVARFLGRMRARGFRMSVASGNGLESVEYLLNAIHVRGFFEHVVTNKDALRPKPAPDIFLAAAEKMNLAPEECVVFEDAINGLQGAQEAGMSSIGLATRIPEEDLRKAGADLVVKDYNEISDVMFDAL